MKNTNIGIFIGIALIWSLIWVTQRHLVFDLIDNQRSFFFLFLGLIPTFGLVVGSFFLRRNFKKSAISLFGKSASYSVLILVLPILCLTIVGVDNSLAIQNNLFGLIIGTFTMFYAFLEEYGWRGYLQPALSTKFNKWTTYIIIGFVWYLWHWYFLRSDHNPKLIMLPILIGASAGIGEIGKTTKSLLICTALHGIANILFIYGMIANQLSLQEKGGILVLCLLIWIPLIKKLEKQLS